MTSDEAKAWAILIAAAGTFIVSVIGAVAGLLNRGKVNEIHEAVAGGTCKLMDKVTETHDVVTESKPPTEPK